jgi:hypothetical protein
MCANSLLLHSRDGFQSDYDFGKVVDFVGYFLDVLQMAIDRPCNQTENG